jgi:hypothetical protein
LQTRRGKADSVCVCWYWRGFIRLSRREAFKKYPSALDLARGHAAGPIAKMSLSLARLRQCEVGHTLAPGWAFTISHRSSSPGYLLSLIPGPDVALIIAHSTQRGAQAGVAAARGIAESLCVHSSAAAVGGSAITLASAWAFTTLTWRALSGCLGITMRRGSSGPAAHQPPRPTRCEIPR